MQESAPIPDLLGGCLDLLAGGGGGADPAGDPVNAPGTNALLGQLVVLVVVVVVEVGL